MSGRFQKAVLVLGPVAVYTAAAAVVLRPFLDFMDRYCLGGGELGGWLWRYDWLKQQAETVLASDWSLGAKFLTVLALGQYPETGNVTDKLVVDFPLEALFGFPAYYNVKCLLLVVTNGLAGYALARHLTRYRRAALLAGLVLAVNPYMLRELYNCGLRQCLMAFLPLYLLFLLKALGVPAAGAEVPDEPAGGWYPGGRCLLYAAIAGLMAGLAAAFYWFYGIFLVFETVIVVGWRLARSGRRSLVLPLALVGVVAFWSALPFAWPYIQSYRDQQFLTETAFLEPFPSHEEIEYYVSDGYRPVSQYESYVASLDRLVLTSKPAVYLFSPREEYPIPYAVGVLALLLIPFGGRRVWPWALGFVLFYVLTLGPFLKWDRPHEIVQFADVSAIRLPYTWFFYAVPGFSRLFGPYRICSMVYVCLAALVAINAGGLTRLVEGEGRRLWRRGLAWVTPAAFVGVLFFQLSSGNFIPLSYCNLDLPTFYKRLAVSQGSVGLIELPINQFEGTVDDFQDALYYYQSFHRMRVLGDWANPGSIHPDVARLPAAKAMVGYSRNDNLPPPAMQRLLHGGLDRGDVTAEDMEILREAGYLYVVLHEAGYDGTGGKNEVTVTFRYVRQRYAELLGEPYLEEEEFPPLETAYQAERRQRDGYRLTVFYLGPGEEP